jgi:ABC-type spermidine/putrescine transport system permease subunit I
MLVMLPMCISFLLKLLPGVSLLEIPGIINNFLKNNRLNSLPLIRNSGAVVLEW